MKKRAGRTKGFTLIEMMVVIALIGILIGGVFRLIGLAGDNAKEAETTDRLQRLENALSGFYAEYGTYPPVPRHGSPDPFMKDKNNSSGVDGLNSDNAVRASRCQPMGFDFPTPVSMDDYIAIAYNGEVYSANKNAQAFDKTKYEWDEVKLFRYGVLSFLLPRLSAIGNFASDGSGGSSSRPVEEFFDYYQWTKYNNSRRGAYEDQLDRESAACARWMPNFEKIIYGGKTMVGIDTGERDNGYPQLSVYTQGSAKHALARMTIRDGWGRELFYYSAPPYQSYKVWSAGPDGNTFPPWVPLSSLTADQRKTVNGWIKDDIARTRK